ncbi:endoplasmic reticulum aminopeptidase 1 isoform X2 [Symphalangus syndactylus]|uniref:endoplasmic reticulum aminopeptidase 1 isoform X2 n=1 Tax=Symphalangus syndactylus TaxID=9590 RepID=UPI0024433A8E|nr:endoplasmic reticulum aminopeptidase 1 isoform X1 [Symphalangus syndactylus]XP_055089332.1 endoplasmic reticulum aminopeptidase 1 isoform X1 [Symphalangus syndactylus]XP_055089333.1 endoplasmic reticulum aminopeptidase 1 isoform X1 [Symphalangus syndactylus]XP_055089334.1 endoplasmic reticulum aminopeptidase 1 isoform X1 [Symphalangus syndactylus]XP_055089335.1 endoplasmic reticulum aminopeptidase 1 isoform X1 [Symphalangus syndactylus]XP_055089336.1 endoplasmic reticulum aminopeptidase 1 i
MVFLSLKWSLATMSFLLVGSLLAVLTVSTPSWCHSSEASPKGSDGTPFPWNKIRLPEYVIPVHYDLLIHANLTTLTFWGTTEVEITANQPTSTIILHSHHLQISRAILRKGAGERLSEEPLQVLEHPAQEQIALLAPEPLLVGLPYTVVIHYAGNLSETFHGFYKSTYRTKEGELRILASTQFEPTAARMAFPCFDEPAFKASFSIKIRREPRHLAISNMPLVKSVTVAEGLIEDHFDVTVKMSTYLVAFIISDFESVSKITKSGVKVSVYAVPDKINQADYALDAAVTLLEFYEDYFSIPYPLPKQDLAAIPDFQSGAMENWGLTTYRESALLFDAEKSSASSKLGITMIVAHELAHQWFGNLVTMEWWNDLWLNEGFAKFMEFVSVSVTHPELKVGDYFFGKCFDAMEVDALNSSHPVSTPVENPAQIREMFDDVSYDKGACILNMLREYLSADAFKSGIVQYLQKHSYKNTKNDDLWDSMASICPTDGVKGMDGFCSRSQHSSSSSHWHQEGLDVKTMMNTWTLQKGFPLITITVRGRNVHMKQEHYMKGSDGAPDTGYLWHVPLTFITSKSDMVHRFLLKTKTDVLILPEEVEWIKFNVGMNGYYIVHYEDDGWDSLTGLLKGTHTAVSSNDRASLINNAFQLVSIGKLSIEKALDLSLYLKHETEIMPVFQGLNELIPMYKLMEKRDMNEVETQFKAFLIRLLRDLIDKQTWTDGGSVSERMLRSQLLLLACVRKYQPCVQRAEGYFRKWKESNGTLSLPVDVTLAVFAVGAQSTEGWDFLYSKYQFSLSSTEKNQIEFALCTTQNKEKLQWLLDESFKGDKIKTQEFPEILILIGRNPVGYPLAWQFLRKNWNKLVQKFELGSSSIAHMVMGTTNQFSTRTRLEEVKGFFSSLKENGSQLRCVQQTIETIEENIRWMDKNFDKIRAWLQSEKLELL